MIRQDTPLDAVEQLPYAYPLSPQMNSQLFTWVVDFASAETAEGSLKRRQQQQPASHETHSAGWRGSNSPTHACKRCWPSCRCTDFDPLRNC